MFNCGEGTQRLAHEHKTKLARLEHIFITRTNWERIGGLPGLCLTVQDSGVPNLTLHGPPGLVCSKVIYKSTCIYFLYLQEELFGAMRRFVILKDLKVNSEVCTAEHLYEDSVMTVKCVPIIR